RRGPRAVTRGAARPCSRPGADARGAGVSRVCPRPAGVMIVRWGLDELGSVLVDCGVGRPLLVASRRWSDFELPGPGQGVWAEVPTADIDGATREAAGCDGVLALGGGSAIDLGKAVSAAVGLPLVSVPTTYSGAEWTHSYGVRDERRRLRGG